MFLRYCQYFTGRKGQCPERATSCITSRFPGTGFEFHPITFKFLCDTHLNWWFDDEEERLEREPTESLRDPRASNSSKKSHKLSAKQEAAVKFMRTNPAGITFRQIDAKFKLSRYTSARLAQRLGISKPHAKLANKTLWMSRPERRKLKQKIGEFLKKHPRMSHREVAERFKVTKSFVAHAGLAAGLRRRPEAKEY